MSLRYEEQRALKITRDFLRLILTKDCPTRKKDLRERAWRCLKHYPFLDKTGRPMFSLDEFPCPEIEDHGANAREGT